MHTKKLRIYSLKNLQIMLAFPEFMKGLLYYKAVIVVFMFILLKKYTLEIYINIHHGI